MIWMEFKIKFRGKIKSIFQKFFLIIKVRYRLDITNNYKKLLKLRLRIILKDNINKLLISRF